MPYPHAGGYDAKYWPNQFSKNTPYDLIGIYTDQATTTLATLYADRDRVNPTANPVTLSATGNNAKFFAEPGDYWAARMAGGVPGTPVAIIVDVDREDAILYPLLTGLLDLRGSYDASTNLFPATGGSGTAGAVAKGDVWVVSVAGTLGGVLVGVGDELLAMVDAPGQTAASWQTLEHNIGYTAADVSAIALLLGNGLADESALVTIDELVVTSALTKVDFYPVPQEYRHLRIEFLARTTEAAIATEVRLRCNGDASALYGAQLLSAAGTGAVTVATDQGAALTAMPIGSVPGATATANYMSGGVVDLVDYAGEVFFKQANVMGGTITSAASGARTFRSLSAWWRSTRPVEWLTLLPASGLFDVGSVFTLYGLKAN